MYFAFTAFVNFYNKYSKPVFMFTRFLNLLLSTQSKILFFLNHHCTDFVYCVVYKLL